MRNSLFGVCRYTFNLSKSCSSRLFSYVVLAIAVYQRAQAGSSGRQQKLAAVAKFSRAGGDNACTTMPHNHEAKRTNPVLLPYIPSRTSCHCSRGRQASFRFVVRLLCLRFRSSRV